jgi:asparagine synthase (glutamine-hydrolysing)
VLASEGLWQPNLALQISNGELSGQIQGRRIGETLWLMLMWRAWRENVLQADSRPLQDDSILPRGFAFPFTGMLKRIYP